MELSIAEFARSRGISDRRALQMVHSGEMPARRLGGRWLIDERELGRRPRLGRPMSPRIAWAFIAVLSGDEPEGLAPSEMARLRLKVASLAGLPEPAALLSSWLRVRAEHHRLSAPASAIGALLADARLMRSGISDPRSGLASGREAEGYVHPFDFVSVVREFLLVPSLAPNVFLHVADVQWADGVPIGVVAADLADHNGPREDAQVRRLLGAP